MAPVVAPIESQSAADPGVLAQLAELGLESAQLPLEPRGDEAKAVERAKGDYQGPAPKVIAESSRPIDRSAPRTLLSGALEAIARGDEAALARLVHSPTEQPSLTEDDAADARRRFLSSSIRPYWDRLSAAVAEGKIEVQGNENEAQVRVRVGGALGSVRIDLRRKEDGWSLAN